MLPWGLLSGELGVYIQGEQEPNASLSSSVANILSSGKQASGTLQHSLATIKHQREQVNMGFTTLPAHLAYPPALLAKDRPKQEAACIEFL